MNIMSDINQAKSYIHEKNYSEALRIARKRHSKDDIESYLTILDLLIYENHIPALEEKGLYYQYYDESHDNGDYGEKYFDNYLKQQPKSINAICDKAMSRFNKGQIKESLNLMDEAYKNYSNYSKIEKPRISKKEILLGKIELLMQAKMYNDALRLLNNYENQFGSNQKSDLYKGQMLQKNGKNEEALMYLTKSLQEEDTLIGFNAKGDALFDLGRYKDALKEYKNCLIYEDKIEGNLELITNFNYKSAFCCINLGDESEAIKYLNKTINMLNEHERLPRDIESIYQKCSFEKERIMKKGNVEDKEFRKSKFFSAKTSLILLFIIFILFIILKLNGY